MFAQLRLPCRICDDIRPVIVEQSSLDLMLPEFRQMDVLVSPGIGVVTVGMRSAQRVPLFGRGRRYEGVEHFGMRFWIGPISRDADPFCAKAFPVEVRILDDEVCSRSGCVKKMRKPTGSP